MNAHRVVRPAPAAGREHRLGVRFGHRQVGVKGHEADIIGDVNCEIAGGQRSTSRRRTQPDAEGFIPFHQGVVVQRHDNRLVGLARRESDRPGLRGVIAGREGRAVFGLKEGGNRGTRDPESHCVNDRLSRRLIGLDSRTFEPNGGVVLKNIRRGSALTTQRGPARGP